MLLHMFYEYEYEDDAFRIVASLPEMVYQRNVPCNAAYSHTETTHLQ
jgi:hypothetical protein